jgi:hypothetical protein
MPSKYFGPGWEDDPSWRDKMDGVNANLQRGQYFVPATMNTGGKILTNSPNARAFIRKSPEDLNVGLVSNVGDAATPNPGVTGPGGSRLFGNRSIPNAPGRQPTMFTNEPGNRSLRERQLMTGTGSVAERRALQAEVAQTNEQRALETRMGVPSRQERVQQMKGDVARDVATIRAGSSEAINKTRLDAALARQGQAAIDRLAQIKATTDAQWANKSAELTARGLVVGSPEWNAEKDKTVSMRDDIIEAELGAAVRLYNEKVEKDLEAAARKSTTSTSVLTPDGSGVQTTRGTTVTQEATPPTAQPQGEPTQAKDSNQNNIDDEDEQAMVWAKENKTLKPLQAQAIEKNIKRKYPWLYQAQP